MPLVDPFASVNRRASLGDARADAVDVEVNVDAVGDGLFVAVLHDEVLVEEAERLFPGRGGQADQEGIEVLEDLAPHVVDRAVTFVDEDDIEHLDGKAWVVSDFDWLRSQAGDRG